MLDAYGDQVLTPRARSATAESAPAWGRTFTTAGAELACLYSGPEFILDLPPNLEVRLFSEKTGRT